MTATSRNWRKQGMDSPLESSGVPGPGGTLILVLSEFILDFLSLAL